MSQELIRPQKCYKHETYRNTFKNIVFTFLKAQIS